MGSRFSRDPTEYRANLRIHLFMYLVNTKYFEYSIAIKNKLASWHKSCMQICSAIQTWNVLRRGKIIFIRAKKKSCIKR